MGITEIIYALIGAIVGALLSAVITLWFVDERKRKQIPVIDMNP